MTTGRVQIFAMVMALAMATGVRGQSINGHQYVDLGLSVVWATCNVGASSPEKSGDYFAWGGTDDVTEWGSDNYKKYSRSTSDISGTVRDVARVEWGGRWRMPSLADFRELLNKCTWTFTTLNGVDGYRVKGRNGNSIFLPSAGYVMAGGRLYNYNEDGLYWSSTPDGKDSRSAINLYFSYEKEYYTDCGDRSFGYTVRPVADKTR